MLKLIKEKTIMEFRVWKLKEKRFKWKSHPFHCLENKKWWGVLIIPSDLNHNIAILKTYRPCINQTIYELARWSLEKEDTPQNAALREFKEEFGIEENPLKIIPLWIIEWATFILNSKIYIFNLIFKDLIKFNIWWEYDGSYEEIYGKYLFNIKKLQNMIKNWDIEDSLTITGIYKYLLYNNLCNIS